MLEISKVPVGICGFVLQGLPVCRVGWNGMCYSNSVCTEQMQLDNPQLRTPAANALYQIESMGLSPESELYKHFESIIEGRDPNEVR